MGSGGELTEKPSGYDRATMLVESRNGSSAGKTNELTKRERQLINEQVVCSAAC